MWEHKAGLRINIFLGAKIRVFILCTVYTRRRITFPHFPLISLIVSSDYIYSMRVPGLNYA